MPNTSGLELETLGVQTNAQGALVIDDLMQSIAASILAAGDCIDQP